MLTISSSLTMMVGQRGLKNAQAIIAQAAERLATGKRINRAADDPSGMIAADKLTVEMAVFEKKIDGLQQERALLGATEGALSVVTELMQELNGLVVSAANKGGLSTEELEGMQLQADEIIEAMDMIANTATFKGEKIFGTLFSSSGRVSVDDDEAAGVGETLQATLAALRSGGLLNLVDGDLEAAQESVESALGSISNRRAAIGARIKDGIEPEINLLLGQLEISAAARSDIEDADIAEEMANLVRGQILQQASINVLLTAQQSPNAALQLLQSSVANS
ncbi:MAG: flagellin [Planctomycetota bacterium]|nr:flagellin [Planctomycetota bacterium]